ncbi:MAG: hypothetical protein ACI8RD_003123 [Bacillariaceae sp.]|jgi:hypothetical protein
MVKGNNHHSRHRQQNHKSHLGTFYPPIEEPRSSSGEESREDFDFKLSSHNNNTSNNIRGYHESSAPSWDMRAAPPSHASTNADAQPHLNPQHDITGVDSYQQLHQNVRPDVATNQWEEYPAQSGHGGTHKQRRDANTNKNIWSSEKMSVQNNDQSADSYSSYLHYERGPGASSSSTTGTLSVDARSWNHQYMGQQQQQQQQQYSSHHDSSIIRDMSVSMNRLDLFSTGTKGDTKTVTGASVTSGYSYSSNTIPGVVGVNSGSTGGESSLTQGQRYQSNYSYGNQRHGGHSMMNQGGQPYYTSQHPIQQQQHPQPQQWHPPNQSVDLFRPIRDREAPPGFHLDQNHEMTYTSMNSTPQIPEERNLIYPKESTSTNDNRRESARNQFGGRHREGQNRDRKQYVGEYTGSNREQGSSHHRRDRSKQPQRQMGTNKSVINEVRGMSSIHHHPRNGEDDYAAAQEETSLAGSNAIRMIMNPQGVEPISSSASLTSSNTSALVANRLPLERLTNDSSQVDSSVASTAVATAAASRVSDRPILPSIKDIEASSLHEVGNEEFHDDNDDDEDEEESYFWGADSSIDGTTISTHSKKRDWLLRMNRRLTEVPIGELDPSVTPISAIMNAWAKTKSSNGASMVEAWLNRAQEEFDAGNTKIIPTNKMFTMAVDAWAKSGEGVSAAQRAETILQQMNKKYQSTGLENLRPTTGIFNAVINAWARSKDKIAPNRAEQILKWMDNLHKTNPSIRPDKYTFNTGM